MQKKKSLKIHKYKIEFISTSHLWTRKNTNIRHESLCNSTLQTIPSHLHHALCYSTSFLAHIANYTKRAVPMLCYLIMLKKHGGKLSLIDHETKKVKDMIEYFPIIHQKIDHQQMASTRNAQNTRSQQCLTPFSSLFPFEYINIQNCLIPLLRTSTAISCKLRCAQNKYDINGQWRWGNEGTVSCYRMTRGSFP